MPVLAGKGTPKLGLIKTFDREGMSLSMPPRRDSARDTPAATSRSLTMATLALSIPSPAGSFRTMLSFASALQHSSKTALVCGVYRTIYRVAFTAQMQPSVNPPLRLPGASQEHKHGEIHDNRDGRKRTLKMGYVLYFFYKVNYIL